MGLIPPSDEILAQLQELAKKGRIFEILEQAQKLEELEPKFVPFAKHLSNLAEGFELDKIHQLLIKQ